VSLENVGTTVSVLLQKFFEAAAKGKSILIIARLSGMSWSADGSDTDRRYRKLVLDFEIEDYYIFAVFD